LQFCLTILHGQGQQEKKGLKAEHAELVQKKSTLRSALCAARASVSKFDSIASFWDEFVNEPEEKERQQQRKARKARARAAAAAVQTESASIKKSKSCIFKIGCENATKQEGDQTGPSSSVSSWGSLLLLGGGKLGKTGFKATTATSEESQGGAAMDRRCDSCGDRDSRVSKVVGKPALIMPPKPMAEPIEIKIDLQRVVAPLEDAVVPYANVV